MQTNEKSIANKMLSEVDNAVTTVKTNVDDASLAASISFTKRRQKPAQNGHFVFRT